MGVCKSINNKKKINIQNENIESGLSNEDYMYIEQKNTIESDTNKLEKIFKTQGKLFNDKNLKYKIK